MADLSQEVGILPGGGHPWGDIYNVTSPEVDKLGERLWQTERLNAVNGNKAAKGLKKQMDDEEFKTSAAIRGADVPDYVNAYSAYKNAQMDFDKNSAGMSLQDRVNAQNNVNNLFSTATKLGNDSKTRKAWELQTGKDILNPANRNIYADNAGDLMTSSINTALAKLNTVSITGSDGKQTTIDLTNPKSFQYQSSTDFAPDFDKAKGKQQTLNAVDNSAPTDLVHNINQYKGFNNPVNYYNTLVSSVASDDTKNKVSAEKRIRDFVSSYGNISDNDYTATEAKYNALISDPSYQKAYGAIQPFPASADNTQTGKVAKYLAMQHALNNPPTSSITYKDNKGNILADDQAFQLRKQAQGLRDAKELSDYKQAQSKGQGTEYLDNNFKDLYNSQGTKLVTTKSDGSTEKAIVLNAPTAFKKAFAAQVSVTDGDGKTATKEIYPDDVVKLDDGNLKGYYYQRDDKGQIIKDPNTGQYAQRKDVTPTETTPEVAKTVYGKILASEAKTYSSSSSSSSTPAKPTSVATSYKIKGKTYSHADLNKMGYTDDQIKQAKANGVIK